MLLQAFITQILIQSQYKYNNHTNILYARQGKENTRLITKHGARSENSGKSTRIHIQERESGDRGEEGTTKRVAGLGPCAHGLGGGRGRWPAKLGEERGGEKGGDGGDF